MSRTRVKDPSDRLANAWLPSLALPCGSLAQGSLVPTPSPLLSLSWLYPTGLKASNPEAPSPPRTRQVPENRERTQMWETQRGRRKKQRYRLQEVGQALQIERFSVGAVKQG